MIHLTSPMAAIDHDPSHITYVSHVARVSLVPFAFCALIPTFCHLCLQIISASFLGRTLTVFDGDASVRTLSTLGWASMLRLMLYEWQLSGVRHMVVV